MNPKWVGWCKQNIVEIAQGMYAADALVFYDRSNQGSDRFWCTRPKKHLASIVRPRDMSFDVSLRYKIQEVPQWQCWMSPDACHKSTDTFLKAITQGTQSRFPSSQNLYITEECFGLFG
ncbi:hypothetical protein H6F61_19150 [Cyanobacteria bacterium FACHB-472]|nr:hypothetical protein [Cyanobacteria bacterium FACHB-472]